MQIANYKPRYIEKIITTDEGRFSARFVVISEGNSFKLKLVEMIAMEAKPPLGNSVFLLSAPKIKQIISAFHQSIEIISPFSNLNFLVSQPTRAPSVK